MSFDTVSGRVGGDAAVFRLFKVSGSVKSRRWEIEGIGAALGDETALPVVGGILRRGDVLTGAPLAARGSSVAFAVVR